MGCAAKGCAWPRESNGYCVPHQWMVKQTDDERIFRMTQPISSMQVGAGPIMTAAQRLPDPPRPAPRGEKWRWLRDKFDALKEGEETEIPVPAGQAINKYLTACHSNLVGRSNKVSFRRNENGAALILKKGEKWETRVAMGEGPVKEPVPPVKESLTTEPPAPTRAAPAVAVEKPPMEKPPARASKLDEALVELQEIRAALIKKLAGIEDAIQSVEKVREALADARAA